MSEPWSALFRPLYAAHADAQAARFGRLAQRLREADCHLDGFASAPGRSELAGNHTDHNRGRVLAAAVDVDAVAAVSRRDDGRIVMRSEGFDRTFEVDLGDGLQPLAPERSSTSALLRGVAAALESRGHRIGGFDAWVTSEVPTGSGLSSSASIEVLIGTILSGLYNGGSIAAQDLAIAGQEAENLHFGKPCGLMDQMASAHGGVVTIDFEEPLAPRVARVDLTLDGLGHRLAVVDTGGSHADLTDDYASIPKDMCAVAQHLGQATLRGISVQTLVAEAAGIRLALGDRALLRALHFAWEDTRVPAQVAALAQGDFATFLGLVRASGLSSMRWLQNVVPSGATHDQGMALALALTEDFLQGRGACRVHGGGFAGAIQVWLPEGCEEAYRALMAPIFGAECARMLALRPQGAVWVEAPRD